MANCINKSHPEIINMAEKLNVSPAVLAAKIGVWQSKNNIEDRFPTVNELQQPNEVNQTLKAVDILQSDKAKQVFEKGNKNKWDLNKILTELQVPKEQKQLILDLGITDREQLALELASNYSYSIKIDTAKEQIKTGTKEVQGNPIKYYSKSENRYYRNTEELGWISSDENNKNQEVDVKTPEDLEPIEFDTYTIDTFSELETKHYSNLTVPGGTNYTENEIATPAITPSIKGHAQFATDNGIGWFRSDDKVDGTSLGLTSAQLANMPEEDIAKFTESTKTRRILEVQSDLFQKGRDKESLTFTLELSEFKEGSTVETSKGKFEILGTEYNVENNTYYKKLKNLETGQIGSVSRENFLKSLKLDTQNQFLQLLNKDNNWVTFFVKSIIQDSAKKGYEKVLFPSGNTASKVEGHTTLEEFKKQKEDRIKSLQEAVIVQQDKEVWNEELGVNEIFPYIVKFNDRGSKFELPYKTKEEAQKLIDSKETEINQLKKELERVETEGFGALRPIYNFYENTVTNILNKTYGKDNVKVITDEYGNTWNEITLEETRDNSTILLNKKDLSEFVNENGKSIFEEKTQISNKTTLLDLNKELLFNNGDLNKSYTSKEVLQNIINSDLNFTDATKDLIFKAMTLLERSNSRVKIISQERFDKMTKNSEGDGTAVMAYNYDLGSVIYIPESSLANFNSNILISSFMHEIAHELTIKALINPETIAEKDFAELIIKAFEQYKYLGERNFSKSYGFTNVKEFVAELYSNAEFQKEIINIDKSLWRKFKDFFRRLLSLPKTLANDELIDSILLIQEVEKHVEQVGQTYTFRNNYSNSFNTVMFKKTDPKNLKLDTLEKKLQYTIDLSKDRISQLIARTSSNKKSKNKKDKEEFLKSFETLLNEIKTLETNDKWKAIISYVTSFSQTVTKTNNVLNSMLYDKETDTFTKGIDSEKMLQTVDAYSEYIAAYDLLDNIKTLISDSKNDITVNSDVRAQIDEIRNILKLLQEGHDDIEATFTNVRRAYTIKEFAKPEYNTRVVSEWRDKLFKEHSKLKIQNETREAYFGRMINGKYKDEYQQALIDSAKSIVNDPTFDLSDYSLKGEDLLNTNSALIDIMSNMIGKMRDNIKSTFASKQFEFKPLFDKYSKEKGQNSQSKMHANLLELSKSEDRYYLKGEYSIDFLDAVNNELYPILNKITELKEKLYDSSLSDAKNAKILKSNTEYKELSKQHREWFNKHTIKIFNENGQSITLPNPKYKNKELTGVEKETRDFFKAKTDKNTEDYDNKLSLVSNLYGAKFYRLPSITKSDLERTFEGDIKGQIVDKYKDLTEIRVDDIGYDEEVNSKNEELRRVRIHYRGKIASKDQSLDLFTVYRKEEWNAINYKEKKSNEIKLKLFMEIARNKSYKVRSKNTGKWKQNKYAENVPGTLLEGEFSNELKKIKGLLETHVYDVLSYNGGKVLGTNADVNKLSSAINGTAASIGMTANLGSGVANVLNGAFQMMIDATGGNLFNKTDYTKAHANYFNPKNQMAILADLGNPVKTSFHNQMLDMFDIIGGFDTATQDFIRNNMAKNLISRRSLNGLNEMGEHMMNTILTESILRGRKVMNKNREFIDKEGNVVSKDKAASLYDMLFLNKDGKLEMSDKVVYTDKNLDSEYHKGGKQHINYLIKIKGGHIFGVYDSLMKAEISKYWWGKTLLMFKNFFLSGFKYRYKGLGTSLKSKDELTDEDITYNNAEQEFTEGIYTSFVRFITQAVIPSLKDLQLAHMKEYYNDLTDHEKANLKKTTLEVSLTFAILPLVGALLGAAAGDDDDNIYFWIYQFRRLESELSQYRDPRELNRMIQNPIAANRFLQNSITLASDLISPVNFFPENNESYFDYLNEDSKGNNILFKHTKKVTPFLAQTDKSYKQLYGLINK